MLAVEPVAAMLIVPVAVDASILAFFESPDSAVMDTELSPVIV
jgi:hypothetical protein